VLIGLGVLAFAVGLYLLIAWAAGDFDDDD